MQKMDNLLTILTIEDNSADLYLIERMLSTSGLGIDKLYSSDTVKKAREILQTREINLVLLDLTLPDGFGINTFIQLKPVVQHIPVIILTGMADKSLALEAIKEGAQDYLVKGEYTEKLLAKSIQYSLERKRSQVRLWESNERFNTVVKATNDAVWDWDLAAGDVFFVGDTYTQLFGHEMVNSTCKQECWEKYIHPDDKDRVLEKLKRIIREAKVTKWEDEYRLEKADGEYAYVHDRGFIIYDADHNPVRVIGAIQDITSRKRSEEIILASEEKYKRIFYKNPYPTWIFELETLRIVEVNDAALEKYRYDKLEFLELRMPDLHPPREVEELVNSLQNAGKTPVLDRKLWHHVKKSREQMIVEINSQLIDYYGKRCMQVIINDITERIRLEKELAMQQRLKQQQITEVVLGAQERERFELGQELHDNINQILATSKLYLDVAIEEEEPRVELLNKSRKNISLAIEEIRKLSKELITPTLNDLGLIQSIKELIRSIQAVRRMKIRLAVTGLDEHFLGQEQKINIYRIIQEQLNNIIKHAQATSVLIRLGKENERISLVVHDDGRGFDTQANRTGVGISNIRSRAELYNGSVDIESAPGKGCRLEVILNSKAIPEEV
ncbi:PAS domain-containing sensor histidine kinase [Flavitalea flava]